MKTSISIPDDLFHAADSAAARFGVSRSELYQRALREFLESRAAHLVTEALDEVYSARTGSHLAPAVEAYQRSFLERETW